jgi:hypothetical protein
LPQILTLGAPNREQLSKISSRWTPPVVPDEDDETPPHPPMPAYIYKNEQQLGPFEDSMIIDAIRAGTYSYDDLCWKEGWEDWKPLRTLFPEPPRAGGTPPPPPDKKSKGKIIALAGSAVLILVILYAASPYYSLWKLKEALSSGDRSSIEALIDFPSVRESLKDQIRVQMTKAMAKDKDSKENPLAAGLAAAFGPAIVNYAVDNFVTPSGIASLIADSKGTISKGADNQGENPVQKKIDWSKVRKCSFNGLSTFVVDVDGTKIFLSFTGTGWRVKNLEIPSG